MSQNIEDTNTSQKYLDQQFKSLDSVDAEFLSVDQLDAVLNHTITKYEN